MTQLGLNGLAAAKTYGPSPVRETSPAHNPPLCVVTGAGVRRKVTGTAGAFKSLLQEMMKKDALSDK
jgi:hypothetical protein